ncbi:MAG: hypothetical protein JWN64_566 [Parcubacteria group bacterium]|nr:hypothetical protein [Parcubacteria group bacterium]
MGSVTLRILVRLLPLLNAGNELDVPEDARVVELGLIVGSAADRHLLRCVDSPNWVGRVPLARRHGWRFFAGLVTRPDQGDRDPLVVGDAADDAEHPLVCQRPINPVVELDERAGRRVDV